MTENDKGNSDKSNVPEPTNEPQLQPAVPDSQVSNKESKSENTGSESDVWTQSQSAEKESLASAASHQDQRTTNGNTQLEWQKDLLNRLAFATLNEQRRSRRWGVFFKALMFIYIGAILFYVPSEWGDTSISTGDHTALIDIDGVIASNTEANADTIVSGLRAAFKNKHTKAVILRINSPGGSPVQAGYINDEIKRLRSKYTDIKLYAVIMDVCASGGYYIAAAADEIYADKASLVGSIGVLMNGFGFVEAMKKLGVERRLITAGDHKGALDPFSPLKKDELEHVQGMLDGVHKQFIKVVREGRGSRLKESPKLFSGLFWNGEEGVELGLVDGLGSSSYVAREIVGVEKIVDFTPRTNYLDRLADRIGVSAANLIMKTMGLQSSPTLE